MVSEISTTVAWPIAPGPAVAAGAVPLKASRKQRKRQERAGSHPLPGLTLQGPDFLPPGPTSFGLHHFPTVPQAGNQTFNTWPLGPCISPIANSALLPFTLHQPLQTIHTLSVFRGLPRPDIHINGVMAMSSLLRLVSFSYSLFSGFIHVLACVCISFLIIAK
jgi:hypothetical protein